MRLVLVLLLALWSAAATAATAPDEMLKDPALEARARTLSREFRCLVCQNESIDDSDADLARDLRRIVRDRLLAGDSDQEVRDYLVARYGQFVLLKPPLEPATWLLWFGPLLAVAGGGGLVLLHLRRRRGEPMAPAELDAAERAELDRMLAEAEGP